MKKLLLLPIALVVLACSSDDAAEVAVNNNETYVDTNTELKSIGLSSECPRTGIVHYCVTSETYNEVEDFIIQGGQDGDFCDLVEFEDIDGVTRTGYVDGMSPNNAGGCIRQTNP